MTADTILSVREAVAYMDENYGATSERHTRRLLSDGRWPCTRTASGHLGITVRDLRKRFQPVKVKLSKTEQAKADASMERLRRKYQRWLLSDEGQEWAANHPRVPVARKAS